MGKLQIIQYWDSLAIGQVRIFLNNFRADHKSPSGFPYAKSKKLS